MQTKLRMLGTLSLTFVAGLLWTSALAAPKPQRSKAQTPKNPEVTRLLKAVTAKFGSKPAYVGVASWYGKQHQGLPMANGKPFDRRKLTAAAWNIPLGTVVRVVNLKNGNSVDVTITDRGPHPRLSRAIDLSEAAAIELDYIREGLTPVFVFPLPKQQFERAEITAELVAPLSDSPVFLPTDGEDRRAVALAMAASLGLIRTPVTELTAQSR